MDSNCQMPKFKRVYSLRINQELKKLGFEPVLETDNINKPGFKCWVYEVTPAFLKVFDRLLREEGHNV